MTKQTQLDWERQALLGLAISAGPIPPKWNQGVQLPPTEDDIIDTLLKRAEAFGDWIGTREIAAPVPSSPPTEGTPVYAPAAHELPIYDGRASPSLDDEIPF